VFHLDVAKVDRDVAYVAMICTCMLQASIPNISSVFGRVLQVCLSGYWICFTHLLQMFYLDVAYILQLF
jgi:hypothetical protein